MTTPTVPPASTVPPARPATTVTGRPITTLRGRPIDDVWTAEDVLAGHPDRVCDAIAEAIVDHAHAIDRDALVGVEVALHRQHVFVTGRVACHDRGNTGYPKRPWGIEAHELEALVAGRLTAAGYAGRWAHDVTVVPDLDSGPLPPGERSIRHLSDDQGIAVGHADPDGPDLMPLEAWTARRLRVALAAARAEHHDGLGPDGKVLVTVRSRPGERPRLAAVNVAIQHAEDVGYPELHRWVVPHLDAALEDLAPHLEPDGALEGEALRLNGIGDFTCGGPMGDNGLSGKKLVVDHYGPRVPIGGGAICGKDAHKPDRVGPLRARQVAVRLARATCLAATVTLGWLPGLEAPDRLAARLSDGSVLDADAIAHRILVPDLTLAGSVRDLELVGVDWVGALGLGYFGTGAPWER